MRFFTGHLLIVSWFWSFTFLPRNEILNEHLTTSLPIREHIPHVLGDLQALIEESYPLLRSCIWLFSTINECEAILWYCITLIFGNLGV
jgi:hypothetical protein